MIARSLIHTRTWNVHKSRLLQQINGSQGRNQVYADKQMILMSSGRKITGTGSPSSPDLKPLAAHFPFRFSDLRPSGFPWKKFQGFWSNETEMVLGSLKMYLQALGHLTTSLRGADCQIMNTLPSSLVRNRPGRQQHMSCSLITCGRIAPC